MQSVDLLLLTFVYRYDIITILKEREVLKMAKYYIYIDGQLIGEIKGIEGAYTAYRRACELVDLLGKDCSLVWAATGEVIETTAEEED